MEEEAALANGRLSFLFLRGGAVRSGASLETDFRSSASSPQGSAYQADKVLVYCIIYFRSQFGSRGQGPWFKTLNFHFHLASGWRVGFNHLPLSQGVTASGFSLRGWNIETGWTGGVSEAAGPARLGPGALAWAPFLEARLEDSEEASCRALQ